MRWTRLCRPRKTKHRQLSRYYGPQSLDIALHFCYSRCIKFTSPQVSVDMSRPTQLLHTPTAHLARHRSAVAG